MFKFLFKRSSKTAPEPERKTPSDPAAPDAQQAKRDAQLERKQAAASRLDALQDETAIAEFLSHCEFADLRLKAAERLHAKETLSRVFHAMRNTDRRVAKLAQTRLKDMELREAQQRHAQACIDAAKRLLAEPVPAASKIVELDRNWAASGVTDDALTGEFTAARAALGERLRIQGELHRSMTHALAELRRLTQSADESSAGEIAEKLARVRQAFDEHANSLEAAAVPKAILAQFADEYARSQEKLNALQRRKAALDEREALLTDWENSAPTELKADALQRSWQSLARLDAEALAPLQQRFDALIAKLAPARRQKPEAPVAPVSDHEAKKNFAETLEALEHAVQDGLLQVASSHDRTLRHLDFKAVHPNDAQLSRLSHARSELQRLKDWAKWGGNVSREELIKAVEELPAEELAVAELAKRIGSSRERWKAMDATAGPAPKALWERFDDACTAAYAPVAAHYQKLAEERQQNQSKAQALLAEVVEYKQSALPDDIDLETDAGRVDWKALAAFCRRAGLEWKRLGPIDRKERKRLDAEFESALQALLDALSAKRQVEIAQREQLIVEAEQLDPSQRNAFDHLKALQARWQDQAKAMPLERRDEQALWQRFRAASDAFFAQRKAVTDAADAERQQNLARKEALCADLENAAAEQEQGSHAAATTLAKLTRDAAAAWGRIGPVPRATEKQIEERYQAAVAALQTKQEAGKRAVAAAQVQALRDKWRLCLRVESAVCAGLAFDEDGETHWDRLAKLADADERAMLTRFNAALVALQQADAAYAAILNANRANLLHGLLRLEILAGLESPAGFASERLQAQVEVLQSSLKNGERPAARRAQLISLLALPAATDEVAVERIERLLATAIV